MEDFANRAGGKFAEWLRTTIFFLAHAYVTILCYSKKHLKSPKKTIIPKEKTIMSYSITSALQKDFAKHLFLE